MDFKAYQPLALVTESRPEKLNINQSALLEFFNLILAVGNVADMVKRRLYYGKPIDNQKLLQQLETTEVAVACLKARALASPDAATVSINDRVTENAYKGLAHFEGELQLDSINIRLLHAALGKFTESAEMLEALCDQFLGQKLDVVNMAEEFGDDGWYGAIGIDELTKLGAAVGVVINERTINLANITKLQGNEKLKGRYSAEQFDAVRAIQRDVEAERSILEQHFASEQCDPSI